MYRCSQNLGWWRGIVRQVRTGGMCREEKLLAADQLTCKWKRGWDGRYRAKRPTILSCSCLSHSSAQDTALPLDFFFKGELIIPAVLVHPIHSFRYVSSFLLRFLAENEQLHVEGLLCFDHSRRLSRQIQPRKSETATRKSTAGCEMSDCNCCDNETKNKKKTFHASLGTTLNVWKHVKTPSGTDNHRKCEVSKCNRWSVRGWQVLLSAAGVLSLLHACLC